MKIEGVEAQLSKDDIEVIEKYSKVGCAVHLGVLNGGSCIIAAKYAVHVIGIDVFENIGAISDECNKEHYTKDFKEFQNTFCKVSHDLLRYDNIKLVKEMPSVGSFFFAPLVVNSLFIDVDHSYEGVKTDYETWFDRISKSGYIMFHDSDKSSIWQGVYKFVEELKKNDKRVEFVEIGGSVSVFRKVEE